MRAPPHQPRPHRDDHGPDIRVSTPSQTPARATVAILQSNIESDKIRHFGVDRECPSRIREQ